MKGQFFVMSTVIMILTLMALIRYFYDFSDINLSELKETSELNYISFIKDSLDDTVSSFDGNCNKLQQDIDYTISFLEDRMIERGIILNIDYQITCPPPNVPFSFTIRTSEMSSLTEFTSS